MVAWSGPGGWQDSGKGGKGGVQVDDGVKKVRRTVGWYNKNGGLAAPIDYDKVKGTLEAIDPRKALEILSTLQEKGPTIRDPTSWLGKAASRYLPELDTKVVSTLRWWNKNGGLTQPIREGEVMAALAAIPPGAALKILKGLEGKAESIRDPTNWLLAAVFKVTSQGGDWGGGGGGGGKGWDAGAAAVTVAPPSSLQLTPSSGGGGGKGWATDMSVGEGYLDPKVLKTVAWYNKHGGMRQPIDLATVAPVLGQLTPPEALQVLKGLDGKGPTIANPTGWLNAAVNKKLQQAVEMVAATE